MSVSNTDKQIIIDLANKIFNHGLSVPAIFFLEMVKYLSFFGSQLLIFFGQIITVFIQSESFYKVAELLEDRKNIELLLKEIERLENINNIND